MNVRAHLLADHEELSRLFEDLQNAVEGADAPTIQSVWQEFEGRVLAHLEAEEKFLFPELEARHPAEISAFKRDHEQIRFLLADLGVRTDLHTLRKSSADALVALLRDHAKREDSTLYVWAETESTEGDRSAVLELIGRAKRRLSDAARTVERRAGKAGARIL